LLPIALASDKDAIATALFSALAAAEGPRVCRIKNTSRLDEFFVSPAMFGELKNDARFKFESEPEPLKFNSAGNLF
ncbi:MAG TPA: hypothetical protein VL325_11815, partial [Pyrinomonadaceae bacterium]|nr:hypothetical protein [Pyrinomonadaceae bacterium]